MVILQATLGVSHVAETDAIALDSGKGLPRLLGPFY